jgi:hypothetical protein
VRREQHFVAVLAIGLLTAFSSGPPVVQAETPPKGDPDHCPPGKDAVEITFALDKDKQCAVVGDVPAVCVDREKSIHWKLTNKDCTFEAGSPAIEISQPKPKGKEKPFTYANCTPRQGAWPAGRTVPLECKVPKDADPGLYKYDVSGQIKRLDPDIEVRKGG